MTTQAKERGGAGLALLLVLTLLPGCVLSARRSVSLPGPPIQVTLRAGREADQPSTTEPGVDTTAQVGAEPTPEGAAGTAGRAAPGSPRGLLDRAAGPWLSSGLRAHTFEVAWRRVRDGFYDAHFNGESWDSIRAVFRPRALATARSGPFHDVLARMLATLRVSHTVVLSPERLKAQRARKEGWTGAEVRHLGEGWVVSRVVGGSPAARAGLRPGDVVDSIAGQTADSIAGAANRPWRTPGEALRATTTAVNSSLAGSRGTWLRVVVRDTLGRERPIRVKVARYPGTSVQIGNLPPIRGRVEVRRLAGGWGYIRWTAFVPGLKGRIGGAIRRFHAAPGLILDLRGNPGGEYVLGEQIAALLVMKPRLLTETRTRHGVRIDRARPARHGYRGPVVVLLDRLSASASEQFAAPLQEMKRVLVVGEPSAGADLEARIVKLPTGGVLMYPVGQPHTPDGRVIEGTGVRPDVEARLSRMALARGHDAQLEAAIAELRTLADRADPQRLTR